MPQSFCKSHGLVLITFADAGPDADRLRNALPDAGQTQGTRVSGSRGVKVSVFETWAILLALIKRLNG